MDRGSPPPRKTETFPSAGKVMVTIFWDSKRITLIDHLSTEYIILSFWAKLKLVLSREDPQEPEKK